MGPVEHLLRDLRAALLRDAVARHRLLRALVLASSLLPVGLLLGRGGALQLLLPLLLQPPRLHVPGASAPRRGGGLGEALPQLVEGILHVQRRRAFVPLPVHGEVRQPPLLVVHGLLARPPLVLRAPRLQRSEPNALRIQRHLQLRAPALVEAPDTALAHVFNPLGKHALAGPTVGGVAPRPAPVLLHERLHLQHALLRAPPLPRAPVHERVEARLVLLAQLVLALGDVVNPPRELRLLLVLL